MAQIFISYKSEERERLRPLVRALQSAGLTVWWDDDIKGGTAWRETIQRELESAGCVLVTWSSGSVGPGGRFVRDEATWALERGTYLPVLLDDIRLPLGFGEVQALSLAGWNGEPAEARFQSLLEAVRERITASRTHAGAALIAPTLCDRGPPALTSAAPAPTAAAPMPQASLRRFSRRAAITGGSLLVAAAGAAWLLELRFHGAGEAGGIAVLPFTNLSNDSTQSYFSEGLAEELREILTRIASFRVIGRASCDKVKDLPANEVASTLDVAHVLTGSVRRTADQLRISAQLIDGANGVTLWSESYDRPPGEAIEIQTGIAENIARALRIRLAPSERAALSSGGTENGQAHDLVLRGSALLDADDSEPAFRKTIALYDAAIAVDPKYYEARLLRAWTLGGLSGIAHSPEETQSLVSEARAEAQRAIKLAPNLARAHAALGFILAADLDLPGALAEYKRAFAISSNDGVVLRAYASYLASLARVDEAVKLSDRVIVLDPLDPISHSDQSNVLFFARRFPEAIKAAQHALAIAPSLAETRTTLADCLSLMGRYDEARNEYAKVSEDDSFRLTGEAILAERTHDRPLAMTKLARLIEVFGDAASMQQAEVHAQLGDLDAAFAALERGYKAKDGGIHQIYADPWLDPLRADARFKAFTKKLALPF